MTDEPKINEIVNRVVTLLEQGATETLPPIVQTLVEREFVSGIIGVSVSGLILVASLSGIGWIVRNWSRMLNIDEEIYGPLLYIGAGLLGVISLFSVNFLGNNLVSVMAPEGQVAKELLNQALEKAQ